MIIHGGEVCVCQLAHALSLPEFKVSRYLGQLRKAGLVEVRKVGTWRYYTLSSPGNDFEDNFINLLANSMNDDPFLRRAVERLGEVECGYTGRIREKW